MKLVKIALGSLIAGVLVALTYHFFEGFLNKSIDYIWFDLFDTNDSRLLIIPIILTLSLIFFGLLHYADRKDEHKSEHSLTSAPPAKVGSYFKVLLIGYFSLLAGASLGPESILIPASIIIGGLLGALMFKPKSQAAGLVKAAAFTALFAAFFNSIVIGATSIFVILKALKVKLNLEVAVVAIIGSVSSFYTLSLFEREAYFELPAFDTTLSANDFLWAILLVGAGYVSVFGLMVAGKGLSRIAGHKSLQLWWQRALLASGFLIVLYLIGGPLTQFTGNKSITDMFSDAQSLGLWGLLGLVVIKIIAISTSKEMGFHGGLVFPMVFVAATLSAMAQLQYQSLNLALAIAAVLVGVVLANRRSHYVF